MYRDIYGLEIGETILQTLRKHGIDTIDASKVICPIYLHSFDYGTIKYWADHTELPRNYLLGSGTSFDLEDINKYATGIGFEDKIVWDYKENKQTDVVAKTRALKMLVHVWTFKDDVLLFEVPNNIVNIAINVGNV